MHVLPGSDNTKVLPERPPESEIEQLSSPARDNAPSLHQDRTRSVVLHSHAARQQNAPNARQRKNTHPDLLPIPRPDQHPQAHASVGVGWLAACAIGWACLTPSICARVVSNGRSRLTSDASHAHTLR